MLRVCSSLDPSNKKVQDPPTPRITSAIFSTIFYYWSQICLFFNVIFIYGNIMQSQCSEWKQMTFEAVFKTLFIEWNYRVPKCDVIENEISEIMGFVKIFRKNNVQDAYSPKISNFGQIVFEILTQLCSDDSIQILLNLTWFLIL